MQSITSPYKKPYGDMVSPNVKVCGAADASQNAARRLPPRPTPLPSYVASQLIPRDVQRAMEHPKDVDIAVVLEEVCDPVVPVKQNPDVAR